MDDLIERRKLTPIYRPNAITAALRSIKSGTAPTGSSRRLPQGLLLDLAAPYDTKPQRNVQFSISLPFVPLIANRDVRNRRNGDGPARLAQLKMEWIRWDTPPPDREFGDLYAAFCMRGIQTDKLWRRSLITAVKWARSRNLSIPPYADVRWKVMLDSGPEGHSGAQTSSIATLQESSAGPAFLAGLHYLARCNKSYNDHHSAPGEKVRQQLESQVLVFILPDVPFTGLKTSGDNASTKLEFLRNHPKLKAVCCKPQINLPSNAREIHTITQFFRILDGLYQDSDSSIYLRFLLWSLQDADAFSGEPKPFNQYTSQFNAIVTGQVPRFHGNSDRDAFFFILTDYLSKYNLQAVARDLHNFISPDDNKIEQKICLVPEAFKVAANGVAAERLRKRLTDYQTYLEMTEEWEKTSLLCETEQSQLWNPKDDEGLKVVEKLYRRANLDWTTTETDSFTGGHFDQEFWQQAIARCQPKEGLEKNHIQWANRLLADTLTSSDESGYILSALTPLPFDSPPRPLRVIEGGVGGANTFFSLCRALQKGRAYPKIRYLGIELNRAYKEMAVQYLTGIGVPRTDDRTSFFAAKEGSPLPIDPIYQKGQLVIAGNMARIVGELVLDYEICGTIDLFISAYAIHHVPNPIRIQQYFRPNRDQKSHPFLNDCFEDLEEYKKRDFVEKLRQGIEAASDGSERSLADGPSKKLAQVILSHLPLKARVRSMYLPAADFLSQAELNMIYTDLLQEKPEFEWMEWALADRQHRLYFDIFNLLRPGGILAIADPDGYSMFNRRTITVSAEMAVAYFRTRTEVEEILLDVGFEILSAFTQIKETDQSGFAVALSNTGNSSSRLQDSNLGYIIIARRPFR